MRFPLGPTPGGACGDKNVTAIAFVGKDGEYLKAVPDRDKDGKEPAGIHSVPLCPEHRLAAVAKGAEVAQIGDPTSEFFKHMVCHASGKSAPAVRAEEAKKRS